MSYQRVKANVYKVRKPCAPGFEHKWCVAWKSDCMRGPAFWYFDTRAEALATVRRMAAS